MFAICYLSAMAITLAMLITLPQKLHRTALCYGALLFGLLGFMMTPRPTLYVDTIRFFDTLDAARNYLHVSPVQAWDYLMNDQGYSATPVMGVIMYIVAIFRQNGWLTFIAATADIGAGLFLIYQRARISYLRPAMVATCFFFLAMFNFNAGVSGIRSYMACGLAVCITYYYSEKGLRPTAFIMYLPLILIHPFSFIALLLHILSQTIEKHRIIYTILCLVLLCERYLQNILFSLFEKFSSIPLFASLSYKNGQYFGESAYIELSSPFSRIRSICIFVFLLTIIIAATLNKPDINIRYLGFIIMLACFSCGSLQDEVLFSRTNMFLLFSELPLVYSLLQRNYQAVHTWKQVPTGIIGILLGSLIFLTDNLRAGIRFEYIQITWTSLVLTVLIIISAITSLTVDRQKLLMLFYTSYDEEFPDANAE
jgi:hypothetical protein